MRRGIGDAGGSMRFAQEMAFYSAYHQERRNILIHVFGVPMISFTLLLVMSWVPLFAVAGFTVTLAMVFAVAVLLYYATLDIPLALATALVFGLLLALAHALSLRVDSATGWLIFAVAQVLGWGPAATSRTVVRTNCTFSMIRSSRCRIMSSPMYSLSWVCARNWKRRSSRCSRSAAS